MRIRNSLNNMLFGLLGQVISMIMGFIVRTVFIVTLGIEYLGVNGLFSDILMLLSLANLGFETAIIYSLYKPLAEKDTTKIQAYMRLYGKAYRIIGIVILAVGLAPVPFLEHLIHGEVNVPHLEIIYVLFLCNTAFSYFFVYKQAVFVADQKQHVISKVNSVYALLWNLLQIALLMLTYNYIVVLVAQIISGIVKNVYISRLANKRYAFLQQRKVKPLESGERTDFFSNLRSLMMYKVSGVVINGTNNIVISKIFGVIWVGLYSNYFLILTTLNTFLGYIFFSITASVGNMNVTESKERKHFIYRVLQMANFLVFGVCFVCLWNVLNPLVEVWLGKDFLLDKAILLTILINFYTSGMQNASTAFRDTTGMFRKARYSPVVAAIANIAFSVYFAYLLGMAGVFMGSIISRLLTYFWVDPYTLHKHVFEQRLLPYFVTYFRYGVLVASAAGICEVVFLFTDFSPSLDAVLRLMLGSVVSGILFYAAVRNSEEFKYLMNIGKSYALKLKPGPVNFNK